MSAAQGRFTSADAPFVAQEPKYPQSWNLYSYTANNPLTRIDPDGRNWFEANGNWTWFQGADVDENGKPCKRGSGGCRHSDYTHLLKFEKTGTNKEGAATGRLTLYEQNRVIATSEVFSGGAPEKGPIPEGTFMMRLDIRDIADGSDLVRRPEGTFLSPFYGIQQIPTAVGGLDARFEWGSIRARLNEPFGETRDEFLGHYLHGKNRPGDSAHGCICERSESILNILWQMDYKKTPKIPVWVRGR